MVLAVPRGCRAFCGDFADWSETDYQAGDQVHQPKAVVAQHYPFGVAGGAGGVNNLEGMFYIHDLLLNHLPFRFFEYLVQ